MWILRSLFGALGIGLASPVIACDLALILAVDISGSVDSGEFEIQMQGLSAGLRDGVVAEALVRGGANIMLVQWTGSSRQEISVPWTEVSGFDALDELAARIDATPRAWRNFSTAIGDALEFSLEQFDAAASCKRRVIDVSGDGINNEGTEPRDVHAALQAGGVTVNALVIEGTSQDLPGYFWENVITGEGAFVITANNFNEYPEKMRQKLMRETAGQISSLPGFGRVPAGFQRSGRALEVLSEAEAQRNGTGLIYPSVTGRELSDSALSKLVREQGIQSTVHGFRASFRTWAQEQTNVTGEVAEAALAHVNVNKVEAAYARSDLFEIRRSLMEAWAAYLTALHSGKVVALAARK